MTGCSGKIINTTTTAMISDNNYRISIEGTSVESVGSFIASFMMNSTVSMSELKKIE
jgi:hypothetical protein